LLLFQFSVIIYVLNPLLYYTFAFTAHLGSSYAYLQILRNLSKVVAKRLATFERKVLRMSGGIKVNEEWGKRYSKEEMQFYGD